MHIITDKKNNCIKDEELDKVSGGAIFQSDREWADKQLWPFIENEGSWTDVVESVSPKLEAYCSKVNAAPGRTESYMNIISRELDEYMMARFFDLGDAWLRNGCKRPRPEDLPITRVPH